MIVVKNINNNVSLCLDSRNREVVVFGKGVGCIKPPAEVPLARIERTFYGLNEQFLPLINDIPSEVLDFTYWQIAAVREQLPYETNSNLVLTLADHLAFAMERAKQGIFIPMPSIYEMEASYPVEVQVGRHIISALEQKFQVKLPSGEIQGVAMHFINARNTPVGTPAQANIEEQYETILEQTTQIIEREMNICVRRNTFSYARFATHVQYLLKRIFEEKRIDSDNLQMYHAIRDEYQKVSSCVDRIAEYYKNNWSLELSEEERLYLIMHVNRVCSKETE